MMTTSSRPLFRSAISRATRLSALCTSSADRTRVRGTKTPPRGGVSLRSRSATRVPLRAGLSGPASRSGGDASSPVRFALPRRMARMPERNVEKGYEDDRGARCARYVPGPRTEDLQQGPLRRRLAQEHVVGSAQPVDQADECRVAD